MRIPKVGEKISCNCLPQFAGVELTIKSVMLGTVFARVKRGREDVPLEEDQFTYLEPETLTGAEKKEIIIRLVKESYISDILAFRKEQGMLNKLIIKYNNCEFWKDFDPGFQVRSLVFFLGQNGSPQIEQKFKQFTLDKLSSKSDNKGSNSTLRAEKIGEDVNIENKPKNLLDILK